MHRIDKENGSSNTVRNTVKPFIREPLSTVNTVLQSDAPLKRNGLKVRNQILSKSTNQLLGNVSTNIRKPAVSLEQQITTQPFDIYIDNDGPSKQVQAKNISSNTNQQRFTVYQDTCNNQSNEDSENQIPVQLKRSVNHKNVCIEGNLQKNDETSCTAFASECSETCIISPSRTLQQKNHCSSNNKEFIPDSPMVLEDKDILDNECIVLEYSQDMYIYLRELEEKIRPKANYMQRQPDITHGMRTILVDWLVEVCEEYKMDHETLFLSVSYIDRFLSIMSVQRTKLQLVGTASMFIASKYEEIYPPDLSEFVYITDDTYTKKQVLRMEHLILNSLSFDLAVPTINYFIQRLAFFTKAPEQIKNLAKYLCELSLLEGDSFMKFLPSEVASSSLALANYTFGRDPWPMELQEASGYNISELDECIICLHSMFESAREYKHRSVMDKYKMAKYNSVSSMSPPPLSK